MKSHDICQTSCEKDGSVFKGLPDEQALMGLCNHLALLADRTRLRIFLVLADCEALCVCDVAAGLDITVSLASHHLRKMREHALLQQRNEGKLVYYSLKPGPVTSILLECVQKLLGQIGSDSTRGIISQMVGSQA